MAAHAVPRSYLIHFSLLLILRLKIRPETYGKTRSIRPEIRAHLLQPLPSSFQYMAVRENIQKHGIRFRNDRKRMQHQI